MVAEESVFPEIVIVFLSETSSSLGWSTVKKIEGVGVEVEEEIETVLVFAGERIFVAW